MLPVIRYGLVAFPPVRLVLVLPFLAALALAQQGRPAASPVKPEPVPAAAEADAAPAVNPAKALKEVEVGEFYLRKRSYEAAILRFKEAAHLNPRLAIAQFRLGGAYEKNGELQKALESYRNFLKLDPDGKKARDARKAIARLEKELR